MGYKGTPGFEGAGFSAGRSSSGYPTSGDGTIQKWVRGRLWVEIVKIEEERFKQEYWRTHEKKKKVG